MNWRKAVSENCTECGLCVKECKFLTRYGNPKAIADAHDPAVKKHQAIPFECSLCGLCGAVCPAHLDPSQMFLAMRREMVKQGCGDYPEHSPVLGYEKRGTSRRYTYYAFPEGCNTVFFPGCTLPGTRPHRVAELYEHLRQTVPQLGIVLDCCSKPSHDLGRDDTFQAVFQEMNAYLLDHGIKTVLVACPNCHQIFKEYGGALAVRTVYEALAETGLPRNGTVSAIVTLHDPCAVRSEVSVHRAVRELVARSGVTIEEMPHHGAKTICCGEGGAVGMLTPELAKNWCATRAEEARDRRIITYCAGCANFLGTTAPTSHILDLVFEPEATLAGKERVAKAPFTYWHRLRLKSRFKKTIEAAVTRERTLSLEKALGKAGLFLRLAMLLLIVSGIVAVRMTGATRYLDQEVLRNLIQSYGLLAPIFYMLIYSIAPSLFLPGLPLTIVGGIVFGPFWGVVYTITSSTLGACGAFLVSRYVARDWVGAKLRSPRWRRLDEGVERHGWKVVALTRLIPLFPFNLLNFAFGLTKIKFLHYAVATFFCMLPACIAFIVFSSSLLDVISGKISTEFILGVGLILAVSLIPVFYQHFKRKSQEESPL